MSHIENTKDEEKDNEIEANRLKLSNYILFLIIFLRVKV
jgi:hypothetical protein